MGRELGVRYLLEGGVRKAGERIRITTQLIEVETGRHLWVERYDRLLDDIFAVQDEIAMSVVGAVEPNLRRSEIERVMRKRPDSLDAYDLVMRAMPFVYQMMPDGAAAALPLLDRAIELEPEYSIAHALAGWCHHFRFRSGFGDDERVAAVRHVRAAIAGGTDDATALAISGLVIWFDERDDTTAFGLFDRALMVSNSNFLALGCSAVGFAWTGQTEEAISRAENALRLSPFDPLNYLPYNALAVSFFVTERFGDAREAALKSVESNPHFVVPQLLLTAALVLLGRDAEVQAAAKRVLELDPTFTITRFSVTNNRLPTVFDPFAKAWRLAGLPEE